LAAGRCRSELTDDGAATDHLPFIATPSKGAFGRTVVIIVMQRGASPEQIDNIVARIKALGLGAHLSSGEERVIVGVVGTPLPPTLDDEFESHDGVERVVRITKKYKLTGWDFHPQKTIINVRGVTIGGDDVVVIAGPCSVESEEQTLATARAVSAAGAKILRGGAYKPRTSPYEFRGLGERGLQILAMAREETGMAIITEVMTPADIDVVGKYTDIFQIGARNSQNYLLLEEVGKAGKPVMIKRGLSMMLEEWLLAAEYVMAQGNPDVILCERGIRTFEPSTRNTFDVSAVPVVQGMSHLPIFVDPSHAAGKRALVGALAQAGVAAGADGLMIEVHPNPDQALSDGAQSLAFPQFDALMPRLAAVANAVGRSVAVRETAPVG
jgi:3-deoxy-7-phosphoheptulonate synthase